jgi:hypothetical protein
MFWFPMRSSWPLLLALSSVPVLLANCRTAVDWGRATEAGTAAEGGGDDAAGGATGATGGRESAMGGASSGGAGNRGGSGEASPGEAGSGERGGGGAVAGGAGDAGAVSAAGEGSTSGAGGSSDACTLDCKLGTACVARDGEWVCEAPTQTRWLAFESYAYDEPSAIQAVRLGAGSAGGMGGAGGELARETLKTFANDRYLGSDLLWSPSGRYLLFREQWADTPYNLTHVHDRWMWSYFGAGLPTKAEPLPNLPNSGQYGLPHWDEATDALAIMNGQESYVVRFDGDRAEAELAVTSDESYEVVPCAGATALVYRSYDTNQVYLVPVGATPDTERVALGGYANQSQDLSKVVGSRPGAESGSEVLFTVDCEAGAVPQVLLEIEGAFWSYEFWPDNRSLLLVKSQGGRTLLELVSLAYPETPLFSGEFSSGFPSWDDSLLLLESALPGSRYHVLEVAGGEPRPLAIDNDALVAWCGQYLLIDTTDSETWERQTHVLDARNSSEPWLLVGDPSATRTQRVCDSSGEFVAYEWFTSSERGVEIFRLATPASPPLVYALDGLGPAQELDILSFYPDERGLTAYRTGADGRIWWLPMPDGVPAPSRELPSARSARFQPWP